MHEPPSSTLQLADDATARYQARRLAQIAIGMLLGLGVSAILDLLDGDRTNIYVHGAAALALAGVLWALHAARMRLASGLLLVTAVVAISLLVWQNAGLRDPAMLAYPGILVFASTMAGGRLFVAVLVTILAFFGLVAVGNVQGWHVNEVPVHSIANLVDVGMVLSITAFVVWLLARDLRSAVVELRAENARVRESRAHIEFLATHDPLTGLPNRLLARDRFAQATVHAQRDQSGVALLFLDLDDFKHINDSLGHPTGDELLRAVSQRLTHNLRAGDTVCRQGGDEFLIILVNVGDEDDIAEIGVKLLAQLTAPFDVDGHVISSSGSLGIALYPHDGSDFDELLKKADMAMYSAKSAGRNAMRYFDEDMNVGMQEHVQLVAGLRSALAQDELMLYFQPQFDLASGRIVGAEALLRWRHPKLGLVPPSRFIRVAEQSGLVVGIGAWVLREACRQMKVWHDLGLADLVVCVNVSPVQFHRNSIELDITNALDASGLQARHLELELTESLLLQDSSAVSELLQRLRTLGVSLAIDDFGTGYSNLGYLKRFEVRRLKIDQSFIRRLPVDKHDEAIVRAIIQMANSLQLTTVAEGVESVEVLARLLDMGCTEGQGQHWSAALPAEEFLGFVRRHRAAGWVPRLA
jgi:diguanylate cyclase (GGDEF)-like protein